MGVAVGSGVGVAVGTGVGVAVGAGVGVAVGAGVGVAVGTGVGVAVGSGVGVAVGTGVGVAVGTGVGVAVGTGVGVAVGSGVGVAVGSGVGGLVGTGVLVGSDEGVAVDASEGVLVGSGVDVTVRVLVGAGVGLAVGAVVGVLVGSGVGAGSSEHPIRSRSATPTTSRLKMGLDIPTSPLRNKSRATKSRIAFKWCCTTSAGRPFVDSTELAGILGEPNSTVHRSLTGLSAYRSVGREPYQSLEAYFLPTSIRVRYHNADSPKTEDSYRATTVRVYVPVPVSEPQAAPTST